MTIEEASESDGARKVQGKVKKIEHDKIADVGCKQVNAGKMIK